MTLKGAARCSAVMLAALFLVASLGEVRSARGAHAAHVGAPAITSRARDPEAPVTPAASTMAAPPGDLNPTGGAPAEGVVTRSFLSRWLRSTQMSLFLAGVVTAIAFTLGTLLGAFAILGPRVAAAGLARLVEICGAMPAVLAVAAVQALGSGKVFGFLAVVGGLRAVDVARVVRARAAQAMAEPYMTAARALGPSPFRFFVKHVWPHVAPAAALSGALAATAALGLDAALAFLGLGVPVDTWGAAIARAWRAGEWLETLCLVVTFATAATSLVVMAFRWRAAAEKPERRRRTSAE